MVRSVFLGAVCVFLGVWAAQARPTRSADAGAQPAEAASPVRPVSVTVPVEGGVVCTHTRRRLWIEYEGWVVRKIATCR